LDTRQQLAEAIAGRKGTRHRRSGQEHWLDFHCPIHDDRHRSASYQPDTGALLCRVCGKLDRDRILAGLGSPTHPELGNGRDPSPTLRTARVLVAECEHPYYWPNAELSHIKLRREYSDGTKDFPQFGPSGTPGRPDPYWPIFGDLGLPQGSHLLLVEGELCVGAVAAQGLQFGDRPIHAVTAGSAQDLSKAAELMVKRIRELGPASLLLWPDNDEPGRHSMASFARRLGEQGIAHAVLDPERYQLGLKEDVVDLLEQGVDLAMVVQREVVQPAPALHGPRDVADRIPVTAGGMAVLPGGQTLVKLDLSWAKTLWRTVAGTQATSRQCEELLDVLRLKSDRDPIPEHHRLAFEEDAFWWRPEPRSGVYRVSAAGIDEEADIPHGVLIAAPPYRPAEINLDDEGESLWNVLESFGLNPHEHDMIEAWLIAAFTGQETPILLLRGEAGAGKSTLARFLVSVVDPSQPEIDGSARIMDDQRQLIRSLQRAPVKLMDNVSSLPASIEDLLCKLVTGYSVEIRGLYLDATESLRLRRSLVMTTISWEAYRGDLSSRLIVAETRRSTDGFASEQEMRLRLDALMPAVRGRVMKRCVQHYANRLPLGAAQWPFRVGSLGRILHSLGRDVAIMAQDEADAKAQLLNRNDPWMQAMVAIWRQFREQGDFILSTSQIVDLMIENGVGPSGLPSPNSKRFAQWLGDKSMIFRDHGFRLERARTAQARGYWFRAVRPFRVLPMAIES
jgi:hypothetical protein